MRVSIGWVPMNAHNTGPYQPTKNKPYSYNGERVSLPPRIYTTERRAAAQSPRGEAQEVFMEMPDES